MQTGRTRQNRARPSPASGAATEAHRGLAGKGDAPASGTIMGQAHGLQILDRVVAAERQRLDMIDTHRRLATSRDRAQPVGGGEHGEAVEPVLTGLVRRVSCHGTMMTDLLRCALRLVFDDVVTCGVVHLAAQRVPSSRHENRDS
jgi:hypothetical protein